MSIKIKAVVLVCVWVILCICYESTKSTDSLVFRLHNFIQATSNGTVSLAGYKQMLESSQPKVILSWTSYFGSDLSKHLESTMGNCQHKCTFTGQRSNYAEAAVVVFHMRNMNSKDLPVNRSTEQLFGFFLQESPYHSGGAIYQVPADYFNITLTYRLDSDVHLGYGMMHPATNETLYSEMWQWDEVERRVEQKNKSAMIMMSNCGGTSKREVYVNELAKHIDISRLGGCFNNTCGSKCAETAIAEHYFYLSFENSVCRDYVTEKVFDRLQKLMVPVVLKRSIAGAFLPKGSFLAADDFPSPKKLAEHLKHLISNKKEYLSYLEWTKSYKKSFNEQYGCDLCRYAHEKGNESHIVSNITDWWFGGGQCIGNYAKTLVKT